MTLGSLLIGSYFILSEFILIWTLNRKLGSESGIPLNRARGAWSKLQTCLLLYMPSGFEALIFKSACVIDVLRISSLIRPYFILIELILIWTLNRKLRSESGMPLNRTRGAWSNLQTCLLLYMPSGFEALIFKSARVIDVLRIS